MRLSEVFDLVGSGDIEELDFCIKKWHMQYSDIRIQNLPLLHCAVESKQLRMIKFLISVGVDIRARDQVIRILILNEIIADFFNLIKAQFKAF